MALRYLICSVIGYLAGSLNFAIIISKLLYKKDIRDYGSKNAGMTNTARTFGKGAGILVFVGDFLKPAIPCYVSMLFVSGFKNVALCGYITGLAVIIGHIFPLYFGFKGGKGVAAMFGVATLLCPPAAFIMAVVFLICLAISKTVSLSSMVSSLFFPLGAYFVFSYMSYLLPDILVVEPIVPVIISSVISLLIIFMHRSNIARIIKGEERKIGGKSKQ